MTRDPSVTIPLSEHNDLLRAAGLDPGRHGLSDLKRLLQQYGYLHRAIVNSEYRTPKQELKAHADAITETRTSRRG